MWDNLFGTVDYLEKGLDASWLRNEVITNNIANVDTPGFKVSDVAFEDIMASTLNLDGSLEMKTTRADHISSSDLSAADEITPVITTAEDSSYKLDDNNVDIESEMVSLAQNSLQYYAMISKINSEFNRLNMAINGQP